MSFPFCPEIIPSDLQRLCRWGVYLRKGRGIPFTPQWEPLSSTNIKTWSHWSAIIRVMDPERIKVGPLFTFHLPDGLCGIDLDGCRNPETGEIDPWAMRIMHSFPTYTEVSKSGTGVKMILGGTVPIDRGINYRLDQLPDNYGKQPGIEIYDCKRCFSLTGWAVRFTGVECCQVSLNRIAWKICDLKRRKMPRPNLGPISFNRLDQELAKKAIEKVQETPPAISGKGGHNRTFFLACYLIRGLRLSEDDALMFMNLYNQKCEPPWSERDLIHKLRSAAKGS